MFLLFLINVSAQEIDSTKHTLDSNSEVYYSQSLSGSALTDYIDY